MTAGQHAVLQSEHQGKRRLAFSTEVVVEIVSVLGLGCKQLLDLTCC
jgi:hypothetical protein